MCLRSGQILYYFIIHSQTFLDFCGPIQVIEAVIHGIQKDSSVCNKQAPCVNIFAMGILSGLSGYSQVQWKHVRGTVNTTGSQMPTS